MKTHVHVAANVTEIYLRQGLGGQQKRGHRHLSRQGRRAREVLLLSFYSFINVSREGPARDAEVEGQCPRHRVATLAALRVSTTEKQGAAMYKEVAALPLLLSVGKLRDASKNNEVAALPWRLPIAEV